MEFLAPIFAVAGALAAGIPLVLHMLRRTPSQRLPFSLVRFLDPSRPQLTRRSTIEHWPLLLLRILALVLLGLAFARPFQRTSEQIAGPDDGGRNTTLLIDRSASMRRTGLSDAVRNAVRSVMNEIGSADNLSVALFSSSVDVVVDRESWAASSAGEKSAAIDRVLADYQPDWHATKTGSALRQMAEQMQQSSAGPSDNRIVLITDFQEGSELADPQSADWARDVTVDLHIVRPADIGNAAVHTFRDRRTGDTHIRVSNATDSARTSFRLQPVDERGEAAGDATDIDVLPGRHVSLPVGTLAGSDSARGLLLDNDAHEYDNRIALPQQAERLSRIAHAGATDANDPETMRYYLQRAFDGIVDDGDDASEQKLEVADLVSDDGIVLPVPDDVRLAVITDAVPGELTASLNMLLDRAGVIVIALSSADMARSLEDLLPDAVVVNEADVDDYAMLGRIDFEHPLFAEFSDARFADFSSIRFWKHRSIVFGNPDPGGGQPNPWNVVAQFDSGEPAIVRIRKSQGEIYVLASGWHPDDSQWALSSRFAPMLAGFLRLASPQESRHVFRTVGDTLRMKELAASDEWTLLLPDGTTVSSTDPDSETVTIDAPGRYILQSREGEETRSLTVLAELDPAESRTVAMPEGQMNLLGLAGNGADQESPESPTTASLHQATAEQLEARQKFWRWLLLAGLSCLLAEAVLAAVIHRRQSESTG